MPRVSIWDVSRQVGVPQPNVERKDALKHEAGNKRRLGLHSRRLDHWCSQVLMDVVLLAHADCPPEFLEGVEIG